VCIEDCFDGINLCHVSLFHHFRSWHAFQISQPVILIPISWIAECCLRCRHGHWGCRLSVSGRRYYTARSTFLIILSKKQLGTCYELCVFETRRQVNAMRSMQDCFLSIIALLSCERMAPSLLGNFRSCSCSGNRVPSVYNNT
jgi:hypothetical protein